MNGRNTVEEQEVFEAEIFEPEPDVEPELDGIPELIRDEGWLSTPKTLSERSKEWLDAQPQTATRVPQQQAKFGNKAKRPKVKEEDDYWMDWKRDLILITPDMPAEQEAEAKFRNCLLAIAQKTAQDYTCKNPRENYMDRHQRVKDVKGFIMAEIQANWDVLMALPESQRYSRAKTIAIRRAIDHNTTWDALHLIPISRIYKNRSAKYTNDYSFEDKQDLAIPKTLENIEEDSLSAANPGWNAPYWKLQRERQLADAIIRLEGLERLAIDMQYNCNWNQGESRTLGELAEAMSLYTGKKITYDQARYALARGLDRMKVYIASDPKLVEDLELERKSLFV